MTWSQVIWKIQNRKRAQKKRKTDAKNRKRAQFEKVFELIIHFRVSRVFFPLPDTFWKSVRLRFFCGFFAFFLRIFCVFFCLEMRRCDVSRHANAWQSLAQRTKTQRFWISVPALMICTVVPGRVQRFEILHTCAGLEAVQYQAQVVHATRDREPFPHGLTMPICC